MQNWGATPFGDLCLNFGHLSSNIYSFLWIRPDLSQPVVKTTLLSFLLKTSSFFIGLLLLYDRSVDLVYIKYNATYSDITKLTL